MKPTLPSGYRLVSCATTGSTNDDARALAADGAADRTLVWALQQEQGRGRRGRPWASQPGNLFASIILRPALERSAWPQASFVAALAVSDVVAALLSGRAAVSCKWPNDVLVDDAKVSGILLEADNDGALICGIGINLVHFPPDAAYPATSLQKILGRKIEPAAALTALVAAFDGWRTRWELEGFSPIRQAWLGRARGLGQVITARLQKGEIKGTFAGLNADGALLLDTAAGQQTIAAGDVYFD